MKRESERREEKEKGGGEKGKRGEKAKDSSRLSW